MHRFKNKEWLVQLAKLEILSLKLIRCWGIDDGKNYVGKPRLVHLTSTHLALYTVRSSWSFKL